MDSSHNTPVFLVGGFKAARSRADGTSSHAILLGRDFSSGSDGLRDGHFKGDLASLGKLFGKYSTPQCLETNFDRHSTHATTIRRSQLASFMDHLKVWFPRYSKASGLRPTQIWPSFRSLLAQRIGTAPRSKELVESISGGAAYGMRTLVSVYRQWRFRSCRSHWGVFSWSRSQRRSYGGHEPPRC